MGVYCIREWLWVCTALAEEERVGVYRISGKRSGCVHEEGMTVSVYSISGRGKGFLVLAAAKEAILITRCIYKYYCGCVRKREDVM